MIRRRIRNRETGARFAQAGAEEFSYGMNGATAAALTMCALTPSAIKRILKAISVRIRVSSIKWINCERAPIVAEFDARAGERGANQRGQL